MNLWSSQCCSQHQWNAMVQWWMSMQLLSFAPFCRLWWTVALEKLLELVGHVQGRQELQMATVTCGLQGLHQNFHVWYVAIIRLGNLAHLTYGFWFYLAI
jgi:hypothetical protein